MGKYFVGGKLRSADTLSISGRRTLAGGTEETIWAGVATTRPTPSSEQLRVVSTSDQDGPPIAQVGTISVACTVEPDVAKVVEATITGTANAAIGKEVDATVTGTPKAITTDVWDCTVGATVDQFDIYRLTVNGTNYDYTADLADTATDVAAGIVALAAGDADYTVTNVAGVVTCTAKVTGASGVFAITSELTYDANADGTFVAVHTTTGYDADIARVTLAGVDFGYTVLAGNTTTDVANGLATVINADQLYTASNVANVITLGSTGPDDETDWSTADGTVWDNPASDLAVGYAVTVAMALADRVAVTLNGVDTFTHKVLDGAEAATALATALTILIAADANWTATSATNVITITGDPGLAYATADATTQNQSVDLAVGFAQTVAAATGDTVSVDDGTTQFDYVVADGDTTTAELATGVAAEIDGSPDYSASAVGALITITAANAGDAFAFSDVSTDNQTADIVLTISDEAVQANVAGTGAKTIRLDYLDGDGVRQNETVTLNGSTAVTSTLTDATAVLGAVLMTFGSGNASVGDITVTDTTGAVIFDFIAATTSQSLAAVYKVPDGTRLQVTSICATADVISLIRLRSDTNPATGAIVSGASYEWHSLFGLGAAGEFTPAVPIGPFPAGASVWLTATESAATVAAVATAGYLEPAV